MPLSKGDFVTVPYTFHMNDISSFPFEGYNPMAYEQALKDEFDQLYEEGATRRRLMVFSMHDRISGHAARVRVLDRFLTYARSKPGVWFARKDEIAKYALETRGNPTPVIQRGPADRDRPARSVCHLRSSTMPIELTDAARVGRRGVRGHRRGDRRCLRGGWRQGRAARQGRA